MIGVVSGQIDIIGMGAIIPDVAKVHIVPDENVVVLKIDIFLDGYTIKSEKIVAFGISSVVSDVAKVNVADIPPEGI